MKKLFRDYLDGDDDEEDESPTNKSKPRLKPGARGLATKKSFDAVRSPRARAQVAAASMAVAALRRDQRIVDL